MEATHLLSRRALLKASPAAAVAALAPSVAAASPQPMDPETDGLVGLPLASVHIDRAVAAMADPRCGKWTVTIRSGDASQVWAFARDFNQVELAISLHRRATQNLDAALVHEDAVRSALAANPRYVSFPRVQYGRLLVGRDADGNDMHEPLFTASARELDDLCERDCRIRIGMASPGRLEQVKARYAALKRDLANQVRRKQRQEKAAGLPQARKATMEASRAEEVAALAILLAKPRNADEQAQKREYMAGKDTFSADWWDAESLWAALAAYAEVRA